MVVGLRRFVTHYSHEVFMTLHASFDLVMQLSSVSVSQVSFRVLIKPGRRIGTLSSDVPIIFVYRIFTSDIAFYHPALFACFCFHINIRLDPCSCLRYFNVYYTS